MSFRSLPMLDSLLRPVRAQGPSRIRGSLTGTVYLLVPFVRETTGRTDYDAQKFIKSLFSNTDYPPLAVRHLDCHSHGSAPITPLFCTTCTLSTSVPSVCSTQRFASTHSQLGHSSQSLLWSSWQATARLLAGHVWDRHAQSFLWPSPAEDAPHAAHGVSHR